MRVQRDMSESEDDSDDSYSPISAPSYRTQRQRVHFHVEELQEYYHLPLKTAAKRLGVCEAALKRICRRNHIRKWPYRQLQSVLRRLDGAKQEETMQLEEEKEQIIQAAHIPLRRDNDCIKPTIPDLHRRVGLHERCKNQKTHDSPLSILANICARVHRVSPVKKTFTKRSDD